MGGNALTQYKPPVRYLSENYGGDLVILRYATRGGTFAGFLPDVYEAMKNTTETDKMARDTVTLESGAQRDSSAGKPRYDLISPIALQRWAQLMSRGADKYAPRNWEKGMPTSRCLESAMRHLMEWYIWKHYGIEPYDTEEDHLAAVLFNIGALIHFEGSEHDDLDQPEGT